MIICLPIILQLQLKLTARRAESISFGMMITWYLTCCPLTPVAAIQLESPYDQRIDISRFSLSSSPLCKPLAARETCREEYYMCVNPLSIIARRAYIYPKRARASIQYSFTNSNILHCLFQTAHSLGFVWSAICWTLLTYVVLASVIFWLKGREKYRQRACTPSSPYIPLCKQIMIMKMYIANVK